MSFSFLPKHTPFGLMLLASLSAVTVLEAQNPSVVLSSARRQFQAGDIQGAAKSLSGILFPVASSLPPSQVEEARLLYGVCNFLLGKRDVASSSFRQALNENSSAQLNSADVVDPEIATSFEKIRAQVIAQGGGKKKTPAAVPPAPKAPETREKIVVVEKPQFIYVTPTPGAIKEEFTGINMMTNATTANIFSDGLFVGTSGENIKLVPGTHKIKVQSEGYEDVEQTIEIKKNEKLTMSVFLKKQEKPQPVSTANITFLPVPPLLRAAPKRSAALAWMPFGVGQFQNDEVPKGVIFGAAQGATFIYGLYWLTAQPDTSCDTTLNTCDVSAYEEDFKKKKYLYGGISMALFGVFWGWSVSDALSNLDRVPRNALWQPSPDPVLQNQMNKMAWDWNLYLLPPQSAQGQWGAVTSAGYAF